MKTFRETNNMFIETFKEYGLEKLISITKGIGFYLLIAGVLINTAALFIKSHKKTQEV